MQHRQAQGRSEAGPAARGPGRGGKPVDFRWYGGQRGESREGTGARFSQADGEMGADSRLDRERLEATLKELDACFERFFKRLDRVFEKLEEREREKREWERLKRFIDQRAWEFNFRLSVAALLILAALFAVKS